MLRFKLLKVNTVLSFLTLPMKTRRHKYQLLPSQILNRRLRQKPATASVTVLLSPFFLCCRGWCFIWASNRTCTFSRLLGNAWMCFRLYTAEGPVHGVAVKQHLQAQNAPGCRPGFSLCGFDVFQAGFQSCTIKWSKGINRQSHSIPRCIQLKGLSILSHPRFQFYSNSKTFYLQIQTRLVCKAVLLGSRKVNKKGS